MVAFHFDHIISGVVRVGAVDAFFLLLMKPKQGQRAGCIMNNEPRFVGIAEQTLLLTSFLRN